MVLTTDILIHGYILISNRRMLVIDTAIMSMGQPLKQTLVLASGLCRPADWISASAASARLTRGISPTASRIM